MRKEIMIFTFLFCLGIFFVSSVYGSSGETEYIINENGQHVCTRSLYANQFAPSYMGCNDQQDLVQGAIFNPGAAVDGTSPILNGFPVSPAMLNSAKVPGVRGILHHERSWAQHENVSTSNFFMDFLIKEVDYVNNQMTLLYYMNLPSSCVRQGDTTINYSESALMKYEGVEGAEKKVLKPSLHLRIYESRPMVVYSFDPEAINPPREPHSYHNRLGWMRMGYFRGTNNGNTYFTEYRNGRWINTFAPGNLRDIDGYRAIPEGYNSVARPGDFIVTAPRMVNGFLDNTSYSNVIPKDEGSVIGYIIDVNGDDIRVETTNSPTGLAEDINKDTVTVTLNSNVEYHHNGQMGSAKSDALQTGNFVRILPEIPNGMLLSRDAGINGERRQSIDYTPSLESAFLSNDPLEFTINDTEWQVEDTVYCVENEMAQFTKLIYGDGDTKVQWYENGKPLTGSKESIDVDGYQFITFSKRCSFSDDRNVYSASSQTLSPKVSSDSVLLIVEPDQTKPGIADGNIDNKNKIRITFNEVMDRPSVETPANYAINNGISINDVFLTGDKKTVVLTTSDMSQTTDYTVTINNVKDIAASPNEININSQITLTYAADESDKQTQIISFPAIEDVDLPESPLTLNASSSSGLNVSYSVIEGPAAVDGNLLTLKDTGTVWVQAEQNGNTDYYSAYPLQQKIQIDAQTKLDQVISLEPIDDTIRVRSLPAFIQIGASASSGLQESYEVVKGDNARFVDDLLILDDTTTMTISIKQPGNYMYNSASPVEKSFFVDTIRGSDYLSFPYFDQEVYLDKNETYSFSVKVLNKYDEELIEQPALSWEVIGEGTIQDGNYTASSVTGGPYFIVASASSGNILPDTAKVFIRKEQSISCSELTEVYKDHEDFVLQCEASSGLPIEYEKVTGAFWLYGDTIDVLGITNNLNRIKVMQNGNQFYKSTEKLLTFAITNDTTDVVIQEPTNVVSKNVNNNTLNVYPNPTKRHLNIKAESPVDIVVYNTLGEKVIARKNVRILDLSDQPAGLYFVRVREKTFKVLKNK